MRELTLLLEAGLRAVQREMCLLLLPGCYAKAEPGQLWDDGRNPGNYTAEGAAPSGKGLHYYLSRGSRPCEAFPSAKSRGAAKTALWSGVLSVMFQTNGLALDSRWAEFFAEHHFLVGVSLDGIRKTHDACRVDANGRGTFHQVMDTISLFRKYQVDFNILTVVNRETSRNIRLGSVSFYQKQTSLSAVYPMPVPFLRKWGVEMPNAILFERGKPTAAF